MIKPGPSALHFKPRPLQTLSLTSPSWWDQDSTHPHVELGPRPPNSSDVLPRLLRRTLTTSENPGFLLSLAGTYVSLLRSQAPLHSRIPTSLPPWMSLRGEETQEKYSEAEETSPAPWGQTWATAVHPS